MDKIQRCVARSCSMPVQVIVLVRFAGQIECYNISSRDRSSYEAAFASPVGISVFESRLYISDAARETVSSVDAADSRSTEERIMQSNIPQPGVLKVYTSSLSGKQNAELISRSTNLSWWRGTVQGRN